MSPFCLPSLIVPLLLTTISAHFNQSTESSQTGGGIIIKFIDSNQNKSFLMNRSFNEIAKEKLANLQQLREQLVRRKYKESQTQQLTNSQGQTFSYINGTTDENKNKNIVPVFRINENTQSSNLVLNGIADSRQQQFWPNVLPRVDILRRLARMRKKLDPNLRNYLTTKYNDFLTNLGEYSGSIGISPFVLNSLKITQNFDQSWNFIEQMLETSSLEQFLSTLPDFATLAKQKFGSLTSFDTMQIANSNDIVKGRSDDDFISDQEPQATSKGKKKYGGLRLSNRVKVYRKGSSGEYEPHRSGYEYGTGTAGDQYGLYSHSSYDSSYGKGYDDYYSTKTLHDKGYGDYSGKNSLKGFVGKYTGLRLGGNSFTDNYAAAGQNSYSYGHGGGGHGGGGGSGLTGYLDPFSVLGGLAFLVYLGLLFQQSLNATGRALPGSSIFDTTWKKPVVLTDLSISKEFESPSRKRYGRHGRSIENIDEFDSEAMQSLGEFWNEVEDLRHIENPSCFQQESCNVIQNLYQSGLLNIFEDELKKLQTGKEYISNIFQRLQIEGTQFRCKMALTYCKSKTQFHQPIINHQNFYNFH